MPLLVTKSRQNPGQYVNLVGVEIPQAAALQEPPHIEAQLLQLPPEPLRQVLPAIQRRIAMPAAHQPQGAGSHQGHVEQVLQPGRSQLQQGPAREQKEEIEHQESCRQKHPVTNQGLVWLSPLPPHPAPHPGLDGPAGQPTQPGAERQHQGHGHNPGHVDRLAPQEQAGAEQQR